MILGPIISLFLGCSALVSGALIEHRAASSTDQPVDVPYNLDMFSQAAVLAQETYCGEQAHDYGLKLGDATLLWTAGDGNVRQRVNLYQSDSLGIAVAIQGTNTSSLRSDLHDAQLRPVDPDNRYRQFLPQGTKVMHGFQKGYTDLVDDIFDHVKKFKQEKNESRVTVIGHSLGAAIGLLASLDISLRLEDGLFKSYLFGLPRVGNPIFANFVDRKIGDKLHWVVNGRDWVPTVPPRALGYQHPSNYVWIYPANSTNWKLYPGQENVHGMLTVAREFNFDDHEGIYFHTQIGASLGKCPAVLGGY